MSTKRALNCKLPVTFKSLTANLLKNLPVKKIVNRLRFDRIVVMSLWPRFWPTLYAARKFIIMLQISILYLLSDITVHFLSFSSALLFHLCICFILYYCTSFKGSCQRLNRTLLSCSSRLHTVMFVLLY